MKQKRFWKNWDIGCEERVHNCNASDFIMKSEALQLDID